MTVDFASEDGDVTVAIQQQPNALTAKKMGVGACVWDGAFLLAAYLGGRPALCLDRDGQLLYAQQLY